MARRVNLVPASERARTTTNFGMLALVAAAIIVVGALGLGYYVLNNNLSDRKAQLAELEGETQTAQAQVAGLQAYAQLDTQRKQVESVVQGAYTGRTSVADILDSLSLVLPDNVWLNQLNLTTSDPGASTAQAAGTGAPTNTTAGENTLTITGDTYTFDDVAQLLVRLQLIPALSGIKLTSAGSPVGSVDQTKNVKGFAIQATVNNTLPSDAPLPVSQVGVGGQ